MKKIFLSITILFIISAALFAGPLDGIQGAVSYSESITIFFNSEANALRWIQTQSDFMSHSEANTSQRRIFASAMESLIPNFSVIMTFNSDYCVMSSRVPDSGGSTLILVVKGEITRLWQY